MNFKLGVVSNSKCNRIIMGSNISRDASNSRAFRSSGVTSNSGVVSNSKGKRKIKGSKVRNLSKAGICSSGGHHQQQRRLSNSKN